MSEITSPPTSPKSPRKTKTAKKPRQRFPRGSGSVEQVGAKFRARKRSGGRTVYGTLRDTWEEADRDRATLRFEDEGLKKGEIPTLSDFTRYLLETDLKRDREYNTWAKQETIWRTRIDEHPIGKKRLDKIDDQDLQRFLDSQRKYRQVRRKGKDGKESVVYELTAEPLAPASLRTIGAFLGVIFKRAKSRRYGYVTGNPASGLEYPKERKKAKRKSLTPIEAAGLGANLLAFATTLRSQGDRFEAMILVARDTGMRRAELCGLLWDNVRRSKDGPYVVVDNTRVMSEGGTTDSATKTGDPREVPISEDTFELIRRQPRRSAYVFTTASGRPVRPDTFTRDFGRFREAVGMPHLKLHGLRNTYISLMLRAKVDLKTIQKQVGHVDGTMIMEVYGETFDDQQRASVGRFQDVLREAEEQLRREREENAG